MRELRRAGPARTAALAALLLLAAAGVLDNVLQSRHTLVDHGRWTNPRLSAWRGAGLWSHMESRRSLRGNALDLHGRHGFYELYWHEPLEPRRVEFRFVLESHSLCFLFNMDAAGFEGVCVEAPAGGFYFAADKEGRFLLREPLGRVTLRAGWNRFAAVMSDRGIDLSLNGAPAGAAPAQFRAGLTGFRGSEGVALVDDVRIQGPDGRALVEESFHHWRGLRGKIWGLAALLAAGALALARSWRGARGAGPWLAAGLLAAAAWTLSWVNFTRFSRLDPSTGDAAPLERRPGSSDGAPPAAGPLE